MTRKAMTAISRCLIIIMAMLTAAFFFWYVPATAKSFIAERPQFTRFFLPGMIWIETFAAVIFACFVPSWGICSSVSNGEGVFTRKNVRRLRILSAFLFADALVFPAGLGLLMILGAFSMFSFAILMPIVIFVFGALGVICYIVAEMVEDVAEEREATFGAAGAED